MWTHKVGGTYRKIWDSKMKMKARFPNGHNLMLRYSGTWNAILKVSIVEVMDHGEAKEIEVDNTRLILTSDNS